LLDDDYAFSLQLVGDEGRAYIYFLKLFSAAGCQHCRATQKQHNGQPAMQVTEVNRENVFVVMSTKIYILFCVPMIF
jgi:hypothetical protein